MYVAWANLNFKVGNFYFLMDLKKREIPSTQEPHDDQLSSKALSQDLDSQLEKPLQSHKRKWAHSCTCRQSVLTYYKLTYRKTWVMLKLQVTEHLELSRFGENVRGKLLSSTHAPFYLHFAPVNNVTFLLNILFLKFQTRVSFTYRRRIRKRKVQDNHFHSKGRSFYEERPPNLRCYKQLYFRENLTENCRWSVWSA